MMHVGIQMRTSAGWPIDSWQEGFEQLRRWGYEHVELAANGPRIDEAIDLSRLSNAQIVEVIRQARSVGLDVSGFQVHHGYQVADPDVLDDQVRHTRRMLDVAEAEGVGLVHVVTGMKPPHPSMPASPRLPAPAASTGPVMSDQIYWQAMRDVFVNLLDYAGRRRVKLGIEQVFIYSVCNRQTLRGFFQLIDRDDLVWNCDPGHFVYHEESFRDAIGEFGCRIANAHIKDSRIFDDPHGEAAGTVDEMPGKRRFEFVAPGTGSVNQLDFVNALHEVGFDGTLVVELPSNLPNRRQVACDMAPFVRRLIEQVQGS
jgi:sugar phosphate isomerase/epimerase